MKLTASGGTDAANIVLFWPDNLPDDADATLKGDPVDLVDQLQKDGKLVWFPCLSDGGYTVATWPGLYGSTSRLRHWCSCLRP